MVEKTENTPSDTACLFPYTDIHERNRQEAGRLTPPTFPERLRGLTKDSWQFIQNNKWEFAIGTVGGAGLKYGLRTTMISLGAWGIPAAVGVGFLTGGVVAAGKEVCKQRKEGKSIDNNKLLRTAIKGGVAGGIGAVLGFEVTEFFTNNPTVDNLLSGIKLPSWDFKQMVSNFQLPKWELSNLFIKEAPIPTPSPTLQPTPEPLIDTELNSIPKKAIPFSLDIQGNEFAGKSLEEALDKYLNSTGLNLSEDQKQQFIDKVTKDSGFNSIDQIDDGADVKIPPTEEIARLFPKPEAEQYFGVTDSPALGESIPDLGSPDGEFSFPDEIKLPAGSSIYQEVVPLLTKELGREPTISEIKLAVTAVCQENGVNVPEWGITGGKHLANNLPPGFNIDLKPLKGVIAGIKPKLAA